MFDSNLIFEAAKLADQGPTGDPWLDALYKENVPALWGKILSDGTRDPSHDEPYYRFLYHLCRLRKPEVAMEVGVDRGVGSAHMASGNAPRLVIGVDIQPFSLPSQIAAHYSNYIYHIGDSVRSVPDLVSRHGIDGKIGVMFIDSSHHYVETVQEWEAYLPLLAPDPILVYDDVTPSFDVLKFFEERAGKKLKFPNMHRGNCIGVILL